MFKIYDGREKFYQWDLDRKLIVSDPQITEVHFCNRTDDCSLVCETFVEGDLTLVNVPNILLQTDWKIRVYAYDGSCTKHDECYEVVSRTKPSDYAYTETEVRTYNELKQHYERLNYYGDYYTVPSDESLFSFYKSGNSAYIGGLKDKNISGEVVIPYKCTINGVEYLVTSIGEQSFVNALNITKITLPNSITYFSTGAFDSCSMTTINIPEGVKYLGGIIFGGCSKLISINIPYGVTGIDFRCFYNCINMRSITIPTTVTYIDDYAFSGCENLTITCAEGSYADTYAKEHGIPVTYTDEITKQFILNSGGKPSVVTEITDTLILEDNQEAQLGELSDLILKMPENVEATYYSSFNFISGETATNLNYAETPIIWCGDDCDEEKAFIPEPNTTYEISIKNLGASGIVARVGVV